MARTALFSSFVLLIATLPSICDAQQETTVPDAAEITQTSWEPGTYIDDEALQTYCFNEGNKLLSQENWVSGTDIKVSFVDVSETASLPLPKVAPLEEDETGFERAYNSTLVFCDLYNCGRCKHKHLDSAGGVALSADGLVLTNYHVINPESDREIYNYFVVNSAGKSYPVIEVLAANKEADIVLVRVDATDLVSVKLADKPPLPLSELFIVGHPLNRFFHTTTGIVSRYLTKIGKQGNREKWMEITTQFSKGSSGCGVFNKDGELAGLVSRKQNLSLKSDKTSEPERLTLFHSVPVEAIKEMISGAKK